MKKAVSPLIATVILIAISVTLGLIIFSSSSGFIEQLSPPTDCSRVSFNAGLYLENNQIILEVDNIGNEIIEGFDIQINNKAQDSSNTRTIDLQVQIGESALKVLQLQELTDNSILTLIPRIRTTENNIAPCEKDVGKIIVITPVSSGNDNPTI